MGSGKPLLGPWEPYVCQDALELFGIFTLDVVACLVFKDNRI